MKIFDLNELIANVIFCYKADGKDVSKRIAMELVKEVITNVVDVFNLNLPNHKFELMNRWDAVDETFCSTLDYDIYENLYKVIAGEYVKNGWDRRIHCSVQFIGRNLYYIEMDLDETIKYFNSQLQEEDIKETSTFFIN